MSDLPRLYRIDCDDSEHDVFFKHLSICFAAVDHDLVTREEAANDPAVIKEVLKREWNGPYRDLFTREEAANEMVKFFNTYCDDAPYWPEIKDALKWLEAGDESA